MGFWNYRVVRRSTDADGKPLERPDFGIHEAFYKESERDKEVPQPHSITVDPIPATAYDVEGLRYEFFEVMARAFNLPVVVWEEVGGAKGIHRP